MLHFGIFSFVSLSMECLRIAPLTPVVMVMRALVFHPLFCKVLISGSYMVCLCMRACLRNLSWQYVNSMNWIVCLGDGDMGVCVWIGAPINMHKMSGHSLTWH